MGKELQQAVADLLGVKLPPEESEDVAATERE